MASSRATTLKHARPTKDQRRVASGLSGHEPPSHEWRNAVRGSLNRENLRPHRTLPPGLGANATTFAHSKHLSEIHLAEGSPAVASISFLPRRLLAHG